MQFLILTLLVAAASATYTYDYSYPSHSYALDNYGSSLYGGHSYGYGGNSYGYGGLGSGVSYLLGGHGTTHHYTAPSIHFIRYVPSHIAQYPPPNRGHIHFEMRHLSSSGGTKSAQSGVSSGSSKTSPPWISNRNVASQGKTSTSTKSVSQTKIHHGLTDSSKVPKPDTLTTTEIPVLVTQPTPVSIPVTTDFPEEDFTDDSVFIEDSDPENEIAETPARPEPLLDDKPQSSSKNVADNSKTKNEFSPESSKKDKLDFSISSQSSRKAVPVADSNSKSFTESGGGKTGIATKSTSSKVSTDQVSNSKSKIDTSRNTFSRVPDLDYDDFSILNPKNEKDPLKQDGGTATQKIITAALTTAHKQIVYNKRPLTSKLTFLPLITYVSPTVIIPEVMAENPVVGYYYEQTSGEYGVPVDVVVTK